MSGTSIYFPEFFILPMVGRNFYLFEVIGSVILFFPSGGAVLVVCVFPSGWINCRFIVFEYVVHETTLHSLADSMSTGDFYEELKLSF